MWATPPRLPLALLSAVVLLGTGTAFALRDTGKAAFQFAIIGDRTGGAVPGVYEEVLREVDADHPDFILSVGDTIEGGSDLTLEAEWLKAMQLLLPYQRYQMFFTPGNHDVWSLSSALAYGKYTKRPLHYGFDYQQAHFTVLDNSRGDNLSATEYAFLQSDLEQHQSQAVKFVVMHRPSWIYYVVLANPNFGLQQLAKRYGVKYVIAGHIHEMLHYELEGVTYLSIASSGGHLRADKAYDKGWFFQHTMVYVQGDAVRFRIAEVAPPLGLSRVTALSDWGPTGLVPPNGSNKN